jgi:predicted transcriptional regulator
MMKKIPKQEYTIEFKEQAVNQVKMGKSIGLVAKELGLVEQTLRNWVKMAASGKLTLDIFGIVKAEAIVDWYKNLDVKRRIMNTLDDYLYDVVKKEKGVDLSDADMRAIINNTLTLAENNYEIFS